MKKKRGLVLCIFCFFLVIALTFPSLASFELGNYSIETAYAPEDSLKGWLNISFQNELSTTQITSNFQGEVTILEFLKQNNADFSCIPSDCKDKYTSTKPELTKTFSLKSGEEKIISFKVTGNITGIDKPSFNLSIDNNPKCFNPLEIDILNDGIIEWKSNELTTDYSCSYETGTGCFNVNEELDEAYIGPKPYCEQISLPINERFQIGARVKKVGDSNTDINMYVYSLDGQILDSCPIKSSLVTSESKLIDCVVEFSNKKVQPYYICIQSEDGENYKIKKEKTPSQPCGFAGKPTAKNETFTHDFYIFAKAPKYGSIGNLSSNEIPYTENYISSYIEKKYNSNCPEEAGGCAIPVKFIAYDSLQVNLFNASLFYEDSGTRTKETFFYDAELSPALINSDFGILNLNFAGIILPESTGTHNLELTIGDTPIATKTITIISMPIVKTISPTTAAAQSQTKFTAVISGTGNISSYKWDFGDSSPIQTTAINTISHIYTSLGAYTLSIETDSQGKKSAKAFKINVVSPDFAINSTLKEYKKSLNNIELKISSYPSWQKEKIKKEISFEELKSNLSTFETQYNSATTQEKLLEIMSSLTQTQIPTSIQTTSAVSFPYYIDSEKVVSSLLEDLGENYKENQEENYKKSIQKWNDKNLELETEFKYITADYATWQKTLFTSIKLKISPKYLKKTYLIINHPKITLKDSSLTTEELNDGEATAITFPELNAQEIEFLAEEKIDLNTLDIYLSPELSKLEIIEEIGCDYNNECEKEREEDWRNCSDCSSPWTKAIIIILLIFAFAFVSYIILYWWYKTRYEKHLFKNKANLYNILNFINSALSHGKEKKEIKENLKRAGWTREQIDYAFKKVQGKKIIPFDLNFSKSRNK